VLRPDAVIGAEGTCAYERLVRPVGESIEHMRRRLAKVEVGSNGCIIGERIEFPERNPQ
jgi:hypothetical protein